MYNKYDNKKYLYDLQLEKVVTNLYSKVHL